MYNHLPSLDIHNFSSRVQTHPDLHRHNAINRNNLKQKKIEKNVKQNIVEHAHNSVF